MRIKNTGRYALAFTINKNGRDISIEFDKRRLYLDTGNIATTGITEISDEDFELLKKNKEFMKALETDSFSEVTAEEVINTSVDTKVIAEKDAEIASLKAELVKKAPTKKELKEKDEALAAKDKEINNLKAQLETLSKSKGKDDITGF